MIEKNINSFILDKDKYLFFDIFYKNDKIYLIMPIYDTVISSDEIIIHVDGKKLNISTKYIKDSHEPIMVYIYDCDYKEINNQENNLKKQLSEMSDLYLNLQEEIKQVNDKLYEKITENDMLKQQNNKLSDKFKQIIDQINDTNVEKIDLETISNIDLSQSDSSDKTGLVSSEEVIIKFEQIDETNVIVIEEKYTPESVIKVSVEYEYVIRNYELRHITTKPDDKDLAITTLFKDDWRLFSIYYDYYKKQGVKHFYLYYNGVVTDEIEKLFNKNDVTLVEWNFKYWNNKPCKYKHHAQIGQIHHAIYRYGKDNWKNFGFCDFDEYLYIEKDTLSSFVNKYSNTDLFGFCNRWSKTLTDEIPETFPVNFKTSSPMPYGDKRRSKNIYKMNSVVLIGIHGYYKMNVLTPVKILNLSMFHFCNWSSQNRTIDNINQTIML